MHRFGEQIEFRIDRRQILLLFLAGLFWTMLAFFLGMMAAGPGQVQKNLSALGWWEHQPKLPGSMRTRVRSGDGAVVFYSKRPKARRSLVRRRRARGKAPVARPQLVRVAPPPVRRLRRLRKRRPAVRPVRSRDRKPSERVRRPRPRVKFVKRAIPPRYRMAQNSMTSSVLRDAQRFLKGSGGSRGSKARQKSRKAASKVHRSCQVRVSERRGRYAILVRSLSDLRVQRRLRLRLRKRGYAVRIVRRGGKFRLELGRYARYSKARRCLRSLRRVHRSVKVVSIK